MSHKNYSAKPLDFNEPFKPKLKAQTINIEAIEKENNSNIKYVEIMTGPRGLEVSNSEIISLTGATDLTDYSHLPLIGNTNPSVQDISEYNPIPKVHPKPQAPVSSTIVDDEIVKVQEVEPVPTTPTASTASIEEIEVDGLQDVSDTQEITEKDSDLESL